MWNSRFLEKSTITNSLKNSSSFVGGTVLDIGCGTKPYRDLFNYKRYYGIDVIKTNSKLDILANAYNIPFKENTIDVLLSTQVLEHLENPNIFMSEAFRVLKNDGKFILTVPQTWKIHEAPHDYYRFTKFGISYILLKSNFKILNLYPRGGVFFVIFQTLNAWINDTPLFLTNLLKPIFFLLFNIMAIILDNLDKIKNDTLGYIVIAEKIDYQK